MERMKYRVRVAVGDGFFKTVDVTAVDEESAKRLAEYELSGIFDGPMAVGIVGYWRK